MAIKRHKPEGIVAKLRQVEVLVGQGMAGIDAIRRISITKQTYYRWRKHYGGMGTDQKAAQEYLASYDQTSYEVNPIMLLLTTKTWVHFLIESMPPNLDDGQLLRVKVS